MEYERRNPIPNSQYNTQCLIKGYLDEKKKEVPYERELKKEQK